MTTQQCMILDILIQFSKIAKQNNFTWYADGGTLLGAIRHGGFIPWDDDADIIMPCADYMKLYDSASSYFSYPYFLQSLKSDPSSPYHTFMKLRNAEATSVEPCVECVRSDKNHGMYIDIFRLEEYEKGKLTQPQFKKIHPAGGYEKRWWNPGGYIKFEGVLDMPIPIGYEQILTKIYGSNWRIPKKFFGHKTRFHPIPYKDIRKETKFYSR